MIKISILYPNSAGARFDMAYYLGTHMPLAIKLLRSAAGFISVSVEEGLSGVSPEQPPAYVAMCDFLFASLDAFMAAFLPHAEQLQGDMVNYTDIEPLIQINTVHIYQAADSASGSV